MLRSLHVTLLHAQKFGTLKPPDYRKILALKFNYLHHNYDNNNINYSDIIFKYNRAIQSNIQSGYLYYAHQLFDEMSLRDVVSFNLLISGYKSYGLPIKAYEIYLQMVVQGLRENPSTFSTVMNICGSFGLFFEGIQVHCRVILFGFCRNVYVGGSIVDFYMKLGFLDKMTTTQYFPLRGLEKVRYMKSYPYPYQIRSQIGFVDAITTTNQDFPSGWDMRKVRCTESYSYGNRIGRQMGFVDDGLKVLDEMSERNVVVWNLVFRGFCELGLWDEIIMHYPRVKFDGVVLNDLMVCYLLQGCCNGKFVSQGVQVHCHALKVGWVVSNRFVANALVDFYSACGALNDAQKVFEVIPSDAVISWNSMVFAYANNDLLFDAVECFRKMQWWSMKPSVRSIVSLVNSCSRGENLFVGQQLHCFVSKLGFDCGSIHAQSALIDMYGKCHDLVSSFKVYGKCLYKTRECCNALLTSMLHCSHDEEVVGLFKFMVDDGIEFDECSLSTTLKALPLSSFASLSSCLLLHSLAIKFGFESHIVVSCSLIDIYSKLGQVGHSSRVFESLMSPNSISYTSIINGYALNGLGKECLKLLDEMLQKGLKPDRVTFLCVLIGCNHSGLVEEGRRVFESMRSIHGVEPDQSHYSCMVDLLGRMGLVYEAEELLELSFVKDSFMWSSLLRSCGLHKNEVVGKRVAAHLMELEPENPATLLHISKFYFEVGDPELSMHYKELGKARPVLREIGHSFTL